MNTKLIAGLVFGITVIIALAMYISTLITDPIYKNFVLYALSGLMMLTIAIIPFFIESHTKKYLETKGANLAQKEDLKELTTIVTEVKNKFVTDSAILQSKLDVVSGHALNLKDEERKAVIALNESYFRWVSMIRGDIITSSVDELNSHEATINEAYAEMLQKEATFILFIGNNQMSEDFSNLKITSLTAFGTERLKATASIKLNLFEISTAKDLIGLKEKYDDIGDKAAIFSERMIEQVQGIIVKQFAFQRLCREFLYSDTP